MSKRVFARPAANERETGQVHQLAHSRHAPANWIPRARLILRRWDGLGTTAIATELQGHPQTVRERIARFTVDGIDGLSD